MDKKKFYGERTWTEEALEQLKNDLIDWSYRYQVSKQDLYDKITELMGFSRRPSPSRRRKSQGISYESSTEFRTDSRVGKKWTSEEVTTLYSLLAQGKSLSEISELLQRSMNGILSRLILCELQKDVLRSPEEITAQYPIPWEESELQTLRYYHHKILSERFLRDS